MMKRIGELKAEVERLKMEQRLKAVPIEAKLMDSIAKLQTRNDHLEANNHRMSREFCNLADDHCRLKAEVERLTKAGDAMIDEWWLQLSCPEWMKKSWMQEQAIVDWNAAKKGGQP
jgi:hypothetical protein